jgi:hypothetical protein
MYGRRSRVKRLRRWSASARSRWPRAASPSLYGEDGAQGRAVLFPRNGQADRGVQRFTPRPTGRPPAFTAAAPPPPSTSSTPRPARRRLASTSPRVGPGGEAARPPDRSEEGRQVLATSPNATRWLRTAARAARNRPSRSGSNRDRPREGTDGGRPAPSRVIRAMCCPESQRILSGSKTTSPALIRSRVTSGRGGPGRGPRLPMGWTSPGGRGS